MFFGIALVGSLLLSLSLALGRVNCSISRPLNGLPLILSLVVLALKQTVFTLSCVWSRGASADLPHLLLLALKPLLLPRHVRLHYRETRQAASWQQLGFRSEWFLSQTIKLVKMFHLVHKPLTTPSFLLVDVHCFLFFLARCHPPFPISVSPSLSVSHSHSVPHVIGEWAHVVPILHVGNSPSVSLSSLYFLSRHPPTSLWCIFTKSRLIFMAVLKGLLLEENGDEERHAGWFPFATYLQVMGLRKSDPREFIMRITNPLCELKHFLLWSLGGSRGVSMTV